MAEAPAWSGGSAAEAAACLEREDPDLHALLADQCRRASTQLSLLAAESVPSAAVRAAVRGLLPRQAEGWPGARLCGGGAQLDALEDLGRRRAAALFGAEHANIQPDSAIQAVLAAYQALCRPGDTVLALDPGCGGHPVHGGPGGAAARLYRFVHYGVSRESGRLDLDEILALARRERPAVIVAGAAAHPRAIDFSAFAAVAASVGARLLVDMVQVAGLVAAGLHPDPVPVADVVVGVTDRTLDGPRGGFLLCRGHLARAVDRAVYPGLQGVADMPALAGKAACLRQAGGAAFAERQRRAQANARELACVLGGAGLPALTGGTDLHLLVLDLRARGLSGRQAERALEAAGILCNRQPVPFDPHPPVRSSGVRLGTSVVTARGMGLPEMGEVAGLLAAVLRAAEVGGETLEAAAREAAAAVAELTARFPLPAEAGIGVPAGA